MAKNKAGGKLVRAALRFLKKQRKRPGGRNRMSGERLDHQQRGGITYSKAHQRLTMTGYHHRPGGIDHAGRRTTDVGNRWDNGVYDGKVEIKNPSPPPPWVPKLTTDGKSTFFPDSWSAERIDNATSDAFKNSTMRDPSKGVWEGFSDGVWIQGRYDPATGNIGHGFPSGNQRGVKI
ncbi:EndoU domain-containing protein [Glycomyces tarimensis]